MVAFVRWLCRTARSFADGPAERGAPAAPLALLLLLARLCLDYEATTISYILTLTDEQFPPQVSPQNCPGWPQNGLKGTLTVPRMSQNGSASPRPSICSGHSGGYHVVHGVFLPSVSPKTSLSGPKKV